MKERFNAAAIGAVIGLAGAANAAAHARELGVSEVIVVTSRWHGRRAGILFRSLLPDLRVSVSPAPTPAPPQVLLRELAVFPLVPFQLARARRRAAELSGTDSAGA